MGIALSACCGFRVFIPMLIAGFASKFHLFRFADQFSWLASTPALISLSVASLLEIIAYYIPFIDNILDAVSTPLSVIAGSLLATSLLPIDAEWMKWIIGIIAGGGSAGLIASGTGFIRLLSSKTTLGAGNGVVATVENASAIGGSLMSFLFPIIMAVLFIIIFAFILKKLFSRLSKSS